MVKNSVKDYSEEDKKKRRIVIYIIIIIIISLSLITSCSCTSRFFGTIGDLFRNEGSFTIDDNTGDSETVLNQDLQFDRESLEISLSDISPKISFTYQNINPGEFTCSTSDASIATCYVSDGYVVINPKGVGEVTIFLQTEANGKIYKASAVVTVNDAERYIELSSKSGTIDLTYGNKKRVSYTLVGLSGDITVSSSDESIAKATVKDGILTITGLKKGTAEITLTLIYNGTPYTAEYTVKVTETKKTNNSGTGTTGNPGSSSGSSGNTGDSGTGDSGNQDGSSSGNQGGTENPGGNTPETKKEYTICFVKGTECLNSESYKIKLEEAPYTITYAVYENGNPISDYKLEDIKISGLDSVYYEIGKDTITIKPTKELINSTANLTVSYKNSMANATLNFATEDYYLDLVSVSDVINLLNGNGLGNIILETNLFNNSEDFKVRKSGNTVCLYEDNKTENTVCLEIVEGADIVDLEYDKDGGTNYPAIHIKATGTGHVNIKVTGSAFGSVFKEFNIETDVKESHMITLNPNGGFFTGLEVGDLIEIPAEYEYVLDLSKYVAYKSVDEENCMYYNLVSFNTKSDGSGKSYSLKDTITNIDSALTLYAIYDLDNPENIELKDSYKLYLVDVDLFHNPEYYEIYDTKSDTYKENVIYPGAKGSYVMTFYNNSSEDLTITGLTLEEDTICIPDNGCLNMGYVIKSFSKDSASDNYYYHSNKNYKVLNTDKKTIFNGTHNTLRDIDFTPNVTVKKGEAIEISLLWKWLDNDELDTMIGGEVAKSPKTINDMYKLTVSLNFLKNNISCKKD